MLQFWTDCLQPILGIKLASKIVRIPFLNDLLFVKRKEASFLWFESEVKVLRDTPNTDLKYC